MKKIIFGFALVLILAIGLGIYYVLTNLDSIVKAAIEKYGSEATHTAVRVDSVKISLTDGLGAIGGLTVANPKDFDTPYAFSLGEIRTKIDIKSLKEEPYVIKEITVRAPEVFYEINKDRQGSLNQLKEQLAPAASPGTKTKGEQTKVAGKEPRLIIRRLHFSEGSLNAKIVPLKNKNYVLRLPKLVMSNLGGKTGATGAQIANEILKRLSDQALAEIKKKGIDQELEKLKAKVEAEKAKLKAETDSKLEAEKKKAKEKLKSLLGK